MIDKRSGKLVFTSDRRVRKHDRTRTPEYIPAGKSKKIYRIRAVDDKDRLTFFKVRTKNRLATVRRFATLKGLRLDRITL